MAKIRPELLDELLGSARTQEDLFGEAGVVTALTAALVERVLGAELSRHLDDEKAAGKRNRRNGTSPKTVQTQSGPMRLDVPRDRESSFEPQFVPKHVRRLVGFDEKVLALYARGMSVREIQGHLEELYHTNVSPELISHVTDAVVEEVREWQNRPLESAYAVVWLDALVVKIKDQGVVGNKSVYVAIGLRFDGRKEVLGLWVEQTEGAKFWLRVLSELRQRGVEDVLFCCCDGLKGFPEAIEATFPRSVVQTCVVHMVRNSLAFVGWKERQQVANALKAIYRASSADEAERALDDFESVWGKRFPAIAPSWRRNWAHVTAFLDYPAEIRRIIYTTNAIESLNFQLRKILKTKGHFPNDMAVSKQLFLALRNVEKKWKRPVPHWHTIFNQLLIIFGADRVPRPNL